MRHENAPTHLTHVDQARSAHLRYNADLHDRTQPIAPAE